MQKRKSIRLKDYDYSKSGMYFVTVCVQNKECLFGNIREGEMILNSAGEMAKSIWEELANKFPSIQIDEYIVMPNHFHGIINIVGADLRVCPIPQGTHVCPKNDVSNLKGEHIGSPLPRMIQWFKTMATNEYIKNVKMNHWPPFPGKLWQRNYYERIIRNERELLNVRAYIQNNPLKWELDPEYPLYSTVRKSNPPCPKSEQPSISVPP